MYPQDLQKIATNQSLHDLLQPMHHEVKLLARELTQLRKALVKAKAIEGQTQFLSAKEVGAELGYAHRTINKWCGEGRIMAHQACYNGSWRIPVSELERLRSEMQGVAPKSDQYRITE